MDAAAPELKSPRRYTNLSAAEFRAALIAKGYSQTELSSERTLRNILNCMIFRIESYTRGDGSDRRPVDPGRING
jgi:hypothetical protein